MKHLTIALICSLLTAVAVIGYYQLAKNSQPTSLAVSQEIHHSARLPGDRANIPSEVTLQKGKHTVPGNSQRGHHLLIENTPPSPQETSAATESNFPDDSEANHPTVWGVTTPSENQEKEQDGIRKTVAIDRAAIGNLRVGQRMTVPIPQLEAAFTGKVEQMIKHNNGDTTWRGHLEEYGDHFRVVITQGKDSSFASIDTPNGSYHLEAHGNTGWVAAAADLNAEIDYSKPDFIIPRGNPVR